MSATAEIIEGLAKLSPRQLAAVAEVVKAMAEVESERRPCAADLLGRYADGSCQVTLEDIRANRDAMAAEVEAKWAAREGWL